MIWPTPTNANEKAQLEKAKKYGCEIRLAWFKLVGGATKPWYLNIKHLVPYKY